MPSARTRSNVEVSKMKDSISSAHFVKLRKQNAHTQNNHFQMGTFIIRVAV